MRPYNNSGVATRLFIMNVSVCCSLTLSTEVERYKLFGRENLDPAPTVPDKKKRVVDAGEFTGANKTHSLAWQS